LRFAQFQGDHVGSLMGDEFQIPFIIHFQQM
jgi:hypothetical protein